MQVHIQPSDDHYSGRLTLRVHLPASYPSSSAPFVELHGEHMSDSSRQAAVAQLRSIFEPGELHAGVLRVFMPDGHWARIATDVLLQAMLLFTHGSPGCKSTRSSGGAPRRQLPHLQRRYRSPRRTLHSRLRP